MFEECGFAYQLVPVNIGKGKKFNRSFWRSAPTTACWHIHAAYGKVYIGVAVVPGDGQ